MVQSAGQGVTAREASIQIYFRWNGKRYRERLALKPTPPNIRYAERLRKEILRRIEIGTFDLLEFFPESKSITPAAKKTFLEVTDAWLKSKTKKIAPTTLKEYKNALYGHFSDFFDKSIDAISFVDVDTALAEMAITGKTFNNLLSPLRMVFDYAVKAGMIDDNPAAKIESAKKSPTAPDPLTQKEVEKILADMREHYPEQVGNYFELAFLTGFRPSEGIAMKWDWIDWNRKDLTISGAKVRGIDKETKTGKARTVELDERCIEVLTLQKKHTFMGKEEIFKNPVTGDAYYDTSFLIEKYWTPCLRRLGIRHRDARQTRHTCATSMLMAGCNPAWAASQLGHSVEMFFRTYSRWIMGADYGRERAKMSTQRSLPHRKTK